MQERETSSALGEKSSATPPSGKPSIRRLGLARLLHSCTCPSSLTFQYHTHAHPITFMSPPKVVLTRLLPPEGARVLALAVASGEIDLVQWEEDRVADRSWLMGEMAKGGVVGLLGMFEDKVGRWSSCDAKDGRADGFVGGPARRGIDCRWWVQSFFLIEWVGS